MLPGLGYMYMGKWIVGIFACFLVVGVYATIGLLFIWQTWFMMNVIMGIDMFLLSNKNKKKILQETTKKCPNCAELIQRDAKLCRFCNTKFELLEKSPA